MSEDSKLFRGPDHSLGELVNRTARLLRRLADQRLAPLGLSSGHLPVLTALMESDGWSQKALTEHAGIEQPTMAATLARMERDGIIERAAGPGAGRAARFSLSARSRARMPEVRALVAALNADARALLTDADERTLRDLLARVSAAARTATARDEAS